MALQFSTAVRNARLDAVETQIGTSARLRVYTGAPPANCAASEAGTLLVEFAMASDWMAAAASGAKALNNLPLTATASAGGTAGHFRILDSGATTCGMQGTITATGSGGDATMSSTTIVSGQPVDDIAFAITDGNP